MTRLRIEAKHRYHADIKDPGPGEHLWTIVRMWRVPVPAGQLRESHFFLDTENLLTLEGPGCYKCEQPYSSILADTPCEGSVD